MKAARLCLGLSTVCSVWLVDCESYFRAAAECEQLDVAFCAMREHCGGIDATTCETTLAKRRKCTGDESAAADCVNDINGILAEGCGAVPTTLRCPANERSEAGEPCKLDSECSEGLLCDGSGKCVTPAEICGANAILEADGITCVCDTTSFRTDRGCEKAPITCGKKSTFDPATSTCVCEPGFVSSSAQDCSEDRVGYCDDLGSTNASYCDPAIEDCPCSATQGEGYPLQAPDGSVTGDFCCCEGTRVAVGNGQCDCPPDTVASGSACMPCAANSHAAGAQCVCDDGFVPSGLACIENPCALHQHWSGTSCDCDTNFFPDGGACIAPPLVGTWDIDVFLQLDGDHDLATTADQYSLHLGWSLTALAPVGGGSSPWFSNYSATAVIADAPGYSLLPDAACDLGAFDANQGDAQNASLDMFADETSGSIGFDRLGDAELSHALAVCVNHNGVTDIGAFKRSLAAGVDVFASSLELSRICVVDFGEINCVPDVPETTLFGDLLMGVSGTATRAPP